jgi:hypothetical protein
MKQVELVVPTGITSFNVSGVNVDIPPGTKTLTVDVSTAEVLKSHGFYPVGQEPAAPMAVDIGAVQVPRQTALDMLKNLGVSMADNLHHTKIGAALVEACRRQAERVVHEINLAEQRGRVGASKEVDDATTSVSIKSKGK